MVGPIERRLRPRLLHALGLAALLLLALASGATAAPTCTGLVVKQSKVPTRTAPGRRLRLSYAVRSNQTTHVALGLIVPPGVIVHKSGSTTQRSKRVTPTNATLVDAQLERAFASEVYWPTSTLLAKKTRKFSTTFKVAKCATMPDYLLFQPRLFGVNNNTIVCTQDMPQ